MGECAAEQVRILCSSAGHVFIWVNAAIGFYNLAQARNGRKVYVFFGFKSLSSVVELSTTSSHCITVLFYILFYQHHSHLIHNIHLLPQKPRFDSLFFLWLRGSCCYLGLAGTRYGVSPGP